MTDFFEEDEKPKNEPIPDDDSAPPKPKNDLATPLPPPRRKRNPFACGCVTCVVSLALACCVLPVILLGIVLGLVAVASSNEITDRTVETLAITDEDDVNLVVSNTTGQISVRGEDDVDNIQVEIIRRGQGLSKNRSQELLDSMQVDVHKDGNQYVVEVAGSEGDIPELDEASADVRITVPRRLNIRASNQEGGITIRDVEIADALFVENNVGGIEFDGKIGPDGSHEIHNNVGGVNLTLDHDSSFHLEARAHVGGIESSINLNDNQESRDGPSGDLVGVYGDEDDPDATLTVMVDVGGINIRD